jgi:two-component system phosphate regulon sensor histidine kinase PhoR
MLIIVGTLAVAIVGHLWLSPLLALVFMGTVLAITVFTQARYLDRIGTWAAGRPDERELPQGRGNWRPLIDRLNRHSREQVRQHSELLSELAQIRAAVDRLPDGLIVLDQAHHVVWSNRAARELHDIFSARGPVHQFIRHPDFIDTLQQRSPGSWAVRMHLVKQPGRVFELRLNSAGDGHRLLITRDVTEQAKLDAMRSDFVANVSHEIRTPATVIAGFAETLLNLDLDEASRRQYLGAILRQSETMGRLVSDLLTLSALERSADQSDEAEIDLISVLSALADETRALSAGRHTVTLRIEGPRRVTGIPGELESAIRNLLTNAVRYTPGGGSITLGWDLRDGEGWISVADTGIGIAAEHLPRISERFYRVDRSRSRETGGTGLGLAIVKRILIRHQAQLKIESQPGKGSTFTIRLPGKRLLAEDPLGLSSGQKEPLSSAPHNDPDDDRHRPASGPAWSAA